jgi:hypothetical protein
MTPMNPKAPEIRRLDLIASEVRAETASDGRRVIRGVAIRYGSLSNPLKDSKGRPFRERFRAGVFSRALAVGADVRFLVNHNRDLVLGRNKAGTLVLSDDPDALRFVAYPPASPIGLHYAEAVARGDMTGVSFRFYKIADLWTGAGEATVRDVIEADIDDISIVAYPAYNDAVAEIDDDPSGAAARSLDDHCRSHPRRDPWLDRAGVRLRLAEADQ